MTHPALTSPPANLAVVETETQAKAKLTSQILAFVKAQTITCAADYELMAGLAQTVKGHFNAAEEQRKAITGPIHNSMRILNSLFAQVTKPLQEAEGICRQKMNEYTVADRAAQVQAMQAAQGAVPLSVVPDVKGISTKIVRSFEITNPDLVERQFCSPDPAKIQAFLDAGGLEAIPGVRFFDTAKTVIRAQRT